MRTLMSATAVLLATATLAMSTPARAASGVLPFGEGDFIPMAGLAFNTTYIVTLSTNRPAFLELDFNEDFWIDEFCPDYCGGENIPDIGFDVATKSNSTFLETKVTTPPEWETQCFDPACDIYNIYENENLYATMSVNPEMGDGLPISYIFNIYSAAPEPGVWVTMLIGLAGLGAALRKRARLTRAEPFIGRL